MTVHHNELHERIRELEAEVAETKRRWAAEPEERKRWQTEQIRLAYEQRLEAVARAEKAERDGALLAKMLDEQNAKLHKAEARVAELTRDKRNMAKVSCNNCGERVWADGEFPEFEAREREAKVG